MFFDALTLSCIVSELRDNLLGGRVQKVLLPDSLSIALEVYSRHQRHNLLASAHAQFGRVHLAAEKPRRGVEKETALLLLLRKYLRGSMLSAIDQPPFERVLRLEFDHPEWGCTELLVEIMGRHSNIILVGAGGRILDTVKRVGPQLSPNRVVLPGRSYTPPPAQAKLPTSQLTEYRLRQILDATEPETQLWRALVAGLRGMSPLLAREIAFRTLGHPRATVGIVEQIAPLLETIQAILSPLADGQWQPSAVIEEDQPVVYAPYLLTHRGTPVGVDSMSGAIEAYAAAARSASPYTAAKRPVQESIGKARKRLDRRRQALERAMQKGAAAETWRLRGEWILAYAHAIAPGQTELLADTGEGEPLAIPLDPELSASDNAQCCFARYRKAQRASAGVPARLKKTELQLRDLEQLDTDLELAANRPEIDAVRMALAEAGYTRARKGKPSAGAPSRPLTLTSPDGLAILVGRNSRQNDEVTFRRASADDWWFHARGVPGAHVIVRSAGTPLPEATAMRAAELAAYFSGLRNEAAVVVDYTQRRHVRRIPGAAPGLVTYSHEQTLRVAPRGPDS